MTVKDVFGRSWAHFIVKQYGPCVDRRGTPRYLGHGSIAAACPIALVVPDELTYLLAISDSPRIGALLAREPVLAELFENIPVEFLEDIQTAHDFSIADAKINSVTFTEAMRVHLHLVAKKWNIFVPAC